MLHRKPMSNTMRTPHEPLSDTNTECDIACQKRRRCTFTQLSAGADSTASSNIALHAITVMLLELAIAALVWLRLHVSPPHLTSIYNPSNFFMPPLLTSSTKATPLCTLYETKIGCYLRNRSGSDYKDCFNVALSQRNLVSNCSQSSAGQVHTTYDTLVSCGHYDSAGPLCVSICTLFSETLMTTSTQPSKTVHELLIGINSQGK